MGVIGLLAAFHATFGSVSDCSKGASQIKINSMSLLPDPPVKGQNSTLTLDLHVPIEIQAGTATYSFTYNFIPFSPTVEDLCTQVPSGCPITVGPLNLISSFPIDPTLSGTLVSKIEWKDAASLQLLCISISMKL